MLCSSLMCMSCLYIFCNVCTCVGPIAYILHSALILESWSICNCSSLLLVLFNQNTTSFNPIPNKPWFLSVSSTRLLKTLWVKEKLLVTSNFSFAQSVFYSFGELLAIFVKFKSMQTRLVRKSLKRIVWERVKTIAKRKTRSV